MRDINVLFKELEENHDITIVSDEFRVVGANRLPMVTFQKMTTGYEFLLIGSGIILKPGLEEELQVTFELMNLLNEVMDSYKNVANDPKFISKEEFFNR